MAGRRICAGCYRRYNGKYTDAAQVGSWALKAIRWANAEGLVNGTSATTLTPKGSATRAQVAVILTQFCQNEHREVIRAIIAPHKQ